MCLEICKRSCEFMGCVCRLLYCVLCLLGTLILIFLVIGLVYYFCFYDENSDPTRTVLDDTFVFNKPNAEQATKRKVDPSGEADENKYETDDDSDTPLEKVTPEPEKLLKKLLRMGFKKTSRIFQAS